MSEKKSAPKNNNSRPRNERRVSEERKAAVDYTPILNKILVCLYALIAITVINTTTLIVRGNTGSTTSNSNNEENQNVDYDVSMFKSVTADTLKDEVSSDTAKIVYIGRSTCGYCVQFLPALQKAQDEYGYETLYLDITTVTTEEQQNKILAFDNDEEFLAKNFGGTPMVLLMKNGELVDTWIGYDEYDAYASWLEGNGFAKN